MSREDSGNPMSWPVLRQTLLFVWGDCSSKHGRLRIQYLQHASPPRIRRALHWNSCLMRQSIPNFINSEQVSVALTLLKLCCGCTRFEFQQGYGSKYRKFSVIFLSPLSRITISDFPHCYLLTIHDHFSISFAVVGNTVCSWKSIVK